MQTQFKNVYLNFLQSNSDNFLYVPMNTDRKFCQCMVHKVYDQN